MQCDDIRAQLSLIRPDSRDAEVGEFASAMAHLQQCADCQAYWELQQQTDRDLSRAIRNVALPTDFKSRLLAQLSAAIEAPVTTPAATETITAETALPTTTIQPVTRTRPVEQAWTRRRAATVVSAALLLLCFGSWFFLNTPRQVQVTVEELVALSLQPRSLPATDPPRLSDLQLPEEIQTPKSTSVNWGTQVVQFQGQDIGVLVPYFVHERGKKSQSVVLMVVTLDPKRIVVSNLSTVGTSFLSARVDYPVPNMYATRVWRVGQQLYICFVRSKNADDLDRLIIRKNFT